MSRLRPDEYRFHHENSACSGVIGFAVDWRLGMIRAYGEGFWSLAQANAYTEQWIDCVTRIHAQGKRARMLIDVRRASIQPAEVPDAFARSVATLYRREDRIAMVVANSLLKLQIRRVVESEIRHYFASPDTAEHWLMSFDSDLGSAR